MKPAALALGLILLAGCAEAPKRFVTDAQDAEIAKACAKGCVIVPARDFLMLLELINGQRI